MRRLTTVGASSVLLVTALAVGGRLAAQAPSSSESIAGTIDVHTHADPDYTPRVMDVIDQAKLSKERGMRGIVIKDHYVSTASVAYLIRKLVPGFEAFGGITLDLTNGGVNPAAVANMAKVTGHYGSVVWMPTFDSEYTVRRANANAAAGTPPRPFASVSKDGELLPATKEVLAIIAKNNMVLATGHSSPAENLMLVREAKKLGVKQIIITHAQNQAMTVPQMQEVAKDGAFVEFCYLSLIGNRPTSAADYAKSIRAIGPEHVIMSTDLGQPNNPKHVDGLASYIGAMRAQGFSQRELDQMTKINPATLLGLSAPQ